MQLSMSLLRIWSPKNGFGFPFGFPFTIKQLVPTPKDEQHAFCKSTI